MAGISFRVEDLSTGSVLDDCNAKVIEARFAMGSYGEKSDQQPFPALALTLHVEGEEEPREPQYWRIGAHDSGFMPSEDGLYLHTIEDGKKRSVRANSNFGFFIKHITEAGFDPTNFNGKEPISNLEGIEAHFKRVPTGNKITGKDGKERDGNVLVIDNIIFDPTSEEKPNTTAKAAAKPTNATAAKSAAKPAAKQEDTSIDDEARTAIVEVLSANNGQLKRTTLTPKLTLHLKGNANKEAILRKALNEAFITSEDSQALFILDTSTGIISLVE